MEHSVHELFNRADDDYVEEFTRRYWSAVDKDAGEGDCWMWTNHTHPTKGHGRIGYCHKGIEIEPMAHRVGKYLQLRKDISHAEVVKHDCLNGWCQNPSHLTLDTNQSNRQDADVAKLTEQDIIDIRMKGYRGLEQTEIAEGYPVGQAHISSICRGEAWDNLNKAPIKGRHY